MAQFRIEDAETGDVIVATLFDEEDAIRTARRRAVVHRRDMRVVEIKDGVPFTVYTAVTGLEQEARRA